MVRMQGAVRRAFGRKRENDVGSLIHDLLNRLVADSRDCTQIDDYFYQPEKRDRVAYAGMLERNGICLLYTSPSPRDS